MRLAVGSTLSAQQEYLEYTASLTCTAHRASSKIVLLCNVTFCNIFSVIN